MQTKVKFALLLIASSILPAAQAHVTLEQQSAPAGSNYKAVFRVGHGCEGSPTTSVTVFLPPGFVGAKPMPKAGWQLAIRNEPLAPADDAHGTHGAPVTQRAAEISWSGGRLLDAEYDEFVLRVTLPRQAGKQYIRVLQRCEKGENDWAAIPEGKDHPALPAAQLLLTPIDAAPAHQH